MSEQEQEQEQDLTPTMQELMVQMAQMQAELNSLKERANIVIPPQSQSDLPLKPVVSTTRRKALRRLAGGLLAGASMVGVAATLPESAQARIIVNPIASDNSQRVGAIIVPPGIPTPGGKAYDKVGLVATDGSDTTFDLFKTAGAGIYANGGKTGVFGVSGTPGVLSVNDPTGVVGLADTTGVVGSGGTNGVVGIGGTYGVSGISTGQSSTGVSGFGINTGMYGKGTQTGVRGEATGNGGTTGVYGDGSNGSGTTGVYGISGSGGIGVWGASTDGTGVRGNGYDLGVEGHGVNTGVSGRAIGSGPNGGYGVIGSGNYTGVYATFNDDITKPRAFLATATLAGDFFGDVNVRGNLSKPAGSFKIDHPQDPTNKYLSHSFVESPDMMNIYNGLISLNDQGEATVEMPSWFEALNSDYRYGLTSIGMASPNLHIAQKIDNGKFNIGGGLPGQEVSWMVTGIRQDTWAKAHRIPVEEEKPLEEKGFYLHPTLFGVSEDRQVGPKTLPNQKG